VRRGAVDMKGAIAAFAAAASGFSRRRARLSPVDQPPDHRRRGRGRSQRHQEGSPGCARGRILDLRRRRADVGRALGDMIKIAGAA